MPKSFRRFLKPANLLTLALVLGGGAIGGSSPAHAHQVRKAVLPLGDGHITFKPAVGNIFVCNTNFAAGGAFRDGPWISGNVWYPDGKVQVEGNVAWPKARVTIAREGDTRVVASNGLPVNARTGVYPVQANTAAYAYDRNPNSILEQRVLLRLPASPTLADKPSCVGMGLIGVTLTGVGIFNGLDGLGRDAAAHEIQDSCNGHPERRGQYHYHNWSPCVPDKGGADGRHSDLVGYVLDGFGIYGPVGEGGKRLENKDLDACHGHTHTIAWDGQEVAMYHYHFTDEYPYSVGCFRGVPVAAPPAPEVAQPQVMVKPPVRLPPPPRFGIGVAPPPPR